MSGEEHGAGQEHWGSLALPCVPSSDTCGCWAAAPQGFPFPAVLGWCFWFQRGNSPSMLSPGCPAGPRCHRVRMLWKSPRAGDCRGKEEGRQEAEQEPLSLAVCSGCGRTLWRICLKTRERLISGVHFPQIRRNCSFEVPLPGPDYPLKKEPRSQVQQLEDRAGDSSDLSLGPTALSASTKRGEKESGG